LIELSLCKSLLMINFSDNNSLLTVDPCMIMALFSYCCKYRYLYSGFQILLLSSKDYFGMLSQSIDYVHRNEIHYR